MGKPETVGRAQNTRLAVTRWFPGCADDMEHERGAFKMNPHFVAWIGRNAQKSLIDARSHPPQAAKILCR
jgi:hypothetical protein